MNAIQRMRATYAFRPVDHLVRREFGIWPELIEQWKSHEGMPADADLADLFGFDRDSGMHHIDGLGWCEPAFVPKPVEQVLEVTDDYELVRDDALRVKKVFRGRRHGFMPTYLKHAVTGPRDWEEDCLPLLDPQSPDRLAEADSLIARARGAAEAGKMVSQRCIGGYMYLRALCGPTEILYLLVDAPGLVHAMMRRWLELVEAFTSRVQRHVRIDQFFIGEDSCYNHGLLISPDMAREFLLPYYQQALSGITSRQGGRRPWFHVDTDGNVDEAIDVYRQAGMNVMSPFEVAAGCDVVAIARKYPDLVMSGGIDKRVLIAGREAIDEYLQRVIPFMVRRGGYIPTCDHGVPLGVGYDSYLHYRRRMLELDSVR